MTAISLTTWPGIGCCCAWRPAAASIINRIGVETFLISIETVWTLAAGVKELRGRVATSQLRFAGRDLHSDFFRRSHLLRRCQHPFLQRESESSCREKDHPKKGRARLIEA